MITERVAKVASLRLLPATKLNFIVPMFGFNPTSVFVMVIGRVAEVSSRLFPVLQLNFMLPMLGFILLYIRLRDVPRQGRQGKLTLLPLPQLTFMLQSVA
jgi:hypothetical protein